MHHKEWGPCELSALRLISVQYLHCCCCWCCCCWACHTRVSADISIKKDFTYKSCEWRSWRRKKKLYVRWGVYNSLHWQISSSELSEKITQAMKKFSSANLICTRQTCVNRHWQSYNILFRDLGHNLEKKERDDVMSWTHTKVLWSSCLLRP